MFLEFDEKLLVLVVVFGVVGGEFVWLVDYCVYVWELFGYVFDVGVGLGCWVGVVFDGGVFGG